jgi:ABC-2 type transport system permease protein
MSAALRLLANEAYLHGTELRRHWLEPLFGLALMSGLFLALYHGVRVFALGHGPAVPADLDGLLLGYLSWTIAGVAYSAITKHITDEAQTGTLEQLHLSPHRFGSIMIGRALVQVGSGLLSALLLAVVAFIGTGRVPHIPLGQASALIALGALSLVGVGLVMGGLVLVFRRLTTLVAIFNLFLLAFACLPAYPGNALSVLPFAYAASAVRAIGAGSARPTWAMYGIVTLSSVTYLVVGLIAYSALERKAKSLGSLTQH